MLLHEIEEAGRRYLEQSDKIPDEQKKLLLETGVVPLSHIGFPANDLERLLAQIPGQVKKIDHMVTRFAEALAKMGGMGGITELARQQDGYVIEDREVGGLLATWFHERALLENSIHEQESKADRKLKHPATRLWSELSIFLIQRLEDGTLIVLEENSSTLYEKRKQDYGRPKWHHASSDHTYTLRALLPQNVIDIYRDRDKHGSLDRALAGIQSPPTIFENN